MLSGSRRVRVCAPRYRSGEAVVAQESVKNTKGEFLAVRQKRGNGACGWSCGLPHDNECGKYVQGGHVGLQETNGDGPGEGVIRQISLVRKGNVSVWSFFTRVDGCTKDRYAQLVEIVQV